MAALSLPPRFRLLMRRQPLKHNHSSGPGQAGGRDPIALLLSKVPLFLESELLPLASCATGRGLSTLPAFEHGIQTTIKRMRLLLSYSLPAYHPDWNLGHQVLCGWEMAKTFLHSYQ